MQEPKRGGGRLRRQTSQCRFEAHDRSKEGIYEQRLVRRTGGNLERSDITGNSLQPKKQHSFGFTVVCDLAVKPEGFITEL